MTDRGSQKRRRKYVSVHPASSAITSEGILNFSGERGKGYLLSGDVYAAGVLFANEISEGKRRAGKVVRVFLKVLGWKRDAIRRIAAVKAHLEIAKRNCDFLPERGRRDENRGIRTIDYRDRTCDRSRMNTHLKRHGRLDHATIVQALQLMRRSMR